MIVGDDMSKVVDAVIGHAVGDAMGVPTEFCMRKYLLKNPVLEMVSSPKIGQPAGTWSDDTSMEICTIQSYIEKEFFDYDDIMTKWMEWINEGKYTATGETFDVGRTCLAAIRKYAENVPALKCGAIGEYSNGNGSLMRILPVAIYSFIKNIPEEDIIKLTNELSSLTHANDISKLGCYIYVKYIYFLLNGDSKETAYIKIQKLDYSMYSNHAICQYQRILKGNIKDLLINDIKSTGYVVDTLECALWIFLNSTSFKECIISSTNIGNDTDTIGAIVGSMAGIIYGISEIPKKWLDKLQRKEYLINLAREFENKLEI